MFEFKITSIKAGWLDAEITNEENKAAYLTASYLNDMPKILLERLNKLALQQNGECAIPIFQEPGIEILHIRKEKNIVDYAIYTLINSNGTLSDQQEQTCNNFHFQLRCKQDCVEQAPSVILLQTSDCSKISLGIDSSTQYITLTIDKIAFENTEEFELYFKGKTSFTEFFSGIVQEIEKYSDGEKLDYYNREWGNGKEWGFKFPIDEYNKSVSILNEI